MGWGGSAQVGGICADYCRSLASGASGRQQEMEVGCCQSYICAASLHIKRRAHAGSEKIFIRCARLQKTELNGSLLKKKKKKKHNLNNDMKR